MNLTGYPGTVNGVPSRTRGAPQSTQFSDIGSVIADPNTALSLLDYGPTDSLGNPITIDNRITVVGGYSGGPLWVYNGTTVDAVGVVATNEDDTVGSIRDFGPRN